MQPTGHGVQCVVQHKVELVRSRDPNGKALLAYTLQRFNWVLLYQLESCEMASAFYGTVLTFLHCALASGTVYCNQSCLCVCNGWAGSVRTLLQPVSVCVYLSTFFIELVFTIVPKLT